jgi:hypothetical protein
MAAVSSSEATIEVSRIVDWKGLPPSLASGVTAAL